MEFKEGDKIEMKSLNEIDTSDPGYDDLNTQFVGDLENEKGKVLKVREIDGGLTVKFPNSSRMKQFTVSPDHVNLILKKATHVPEELFILEG